MSKPRKSPFDGIAMGTTREPRDLPRGGVLTRETIEDAIAKMSRSERRACSHAGLAMRIGKELICTRCGWTIENRGAS